MKKVFLVLIGIAIIAGAFLAVPTQLDAQERKPHCDAVYHQALEDHGEDFALLMYKSCWYNS